MSYSPPLAGYPPIPLTDLAALVASFNGRTGAVAPASGDYTPQDVGFASGFPVSTPFSLADLTALLAAANRWTAEQIFNAGIDSSAVPIPLSSLSALVASKGTVYTSGSGTYDLPSGYSYAIALLIGGGGGGGSGAPTTGGGGGGSGGVSISVFSGSSSYVVGGGGSGGAQGGSVGVGGGTSSIGGVTAGGGAGGDYTGVGGLGGSGNMSIGNAGGTSNTNIPFGAGGSAVVGLGGAGGAGGVSTNSAPGNAGASGIILILPVV